MAPASLSASDCRSSAAAVAVVAELAVAGLTGRESA